jgi:hypothetical protein
MNFKLLPQQFLVYKSVAGELDLLAAKGTSRDKKRVVGRGLNKQGGLFHGDSVARNSRDTKLFCSTSMAFGWAN